MKATIFILICSFIPALAADLVMRNGVTYNDVEPYNSDDVGVTIRYGPTNSRRTIKLSWAWVTQEQRQQLDRLKAVTKLKTRLKALTEEESDIRARLAAVPNEKARERYGRSRERRYIFNNATSAADINLMNERLRTIASEKPQLEEQIKQTAQ